MATILRPDSIVAAAGIALCKSVFFLALGRKRGQHVLRWWYSDAMRVVLRPR